MYYIDIFILSFGKKRVLFIEENLRKPIDLL
jgi:hypothetical protein